VIINLIAGTTTSTGLKVHARLDDNAYPDNIEITDQQLAAVNVQRHACHAEWNYTSNHHPIERRPLN
jgi:hypothetical protein